MEFIPPILMTMSEMEKRIIRDQLEGLYHGKKVPGWILIIDFVEIHPFRMQLSEFIQRRTLLRTWNMGIVLRELGCSRETLKVWDSYLAFEDVDILPSRIVNLMGSLAEVAPDRSGLGNIAWVKYLCRMKDGQTYRFPPGENWKQIKTFMDIQEA